MLNNRSTEIGRRAFLLATAVLAAGCIRGDPGGRVRLAAGDRGGLYLAFGEIFAKRLQTRYPGIAVDVLPTEGSVENLARLRAADVDMGLALADVVERDRATGPAGTAPLAVARVYENYLQVIVRESAAAKQLSDLQGLRVSIGPGGSGAAATSEVLFEAAGLRGRVDMLRYRLREGLARLADGSADALVWSGGVPTPAVAELDAELPLRMLDIGSLAVPMSHLAGYPYVVRRVPSGGYVPTRHPFYRSARPAAVPRRRGGRSGRRRGGCTRNRRTATSAPRRPRVAIPRPTVDAPDRSGSPASGCRSGLPHVARLSVNPLL